MNIGSRFIMALMSAVPLLLIKEALDLGWFSTPFGRPFTRRLQPGAYWASVLVCTSAALALILTAILA